LSSFSNSDGVTFALEDVFESGNDVEGFRRALEAGRRRLAATARTNATPRSARDCSDRRALAGVTGDRADRETRERTTRGAAHRAALRLLILGESFAVVLLELAVGHVRIPRGLLRRVVVAGELVGLLLLRGLPLRGVDHALCRVRARGQRCVGGRRGRRILSPCEARSNRKHEGDERRAADEMGGVHGKASS